MLEYDLALTDSRRRIRESEARATLMSQLGALPPLIGLPLFRRDARPLANEVVIRHDAPAPMTAPPAKAA